MTSNNTVLKIFLEVILNLNLNDYNFHIYSTEITTSINFPKNTALIKKNPLDSELDQLKLYKTGILIHYKKIVPKAALSILKFINIHPGYNPFNRGYYPHIHSIINGKPAGVTIHEVNNQIDLGPVIYQEKINISPDDTSQSLYNKVICLERLMLYKYLKSMLDNDYELIKLQQIGNINNLNDFERLKKLNLNENNSFRYFINLLRAMTHEGFDNAYFVEDNKKFYVRIEIKKE